MADLGVAGDVGAPTGKPTLTAPKQTKMRTALVGLLVFGSIVLLTALAPLLPLHSPFNQDVVSRLASPSAQHWLGLDHLGRDVLSRLIFGGRYSMVIAAITVTITAVFGTLVGAISGRARGAIDEILMRIVDLLVAIPELVVALIIVGLFGTNFVVVLLALTVSAWAPFARLARGITLELNTLEYIEAAEALGYGRLSIIFYHVVPNLFGAVSSMAFLRFGHALITVGSLSYLGLGAQPPTPDWGAMLSEGQAYMQREPLLVLLPGLMIFITALSVTLAGQGLSVVLDPKQRRFARTRAVSEV